jgi:dnd system-associated protein 4
MNLTERIIRQPKNHEKLIETLTTQGLFENKQALMMFAAAVGWRFVGKRQTEYLPGESIPWHIFEANNDDAFINALAIAETNAIDILESVDAEETEDIPVQIFEGYAVSGFEYIEQQCINVPGDVLENLLALILQINYSQI